MGIKDHLYGIERAIRQLEALSQQVTYLPEAQQKILVDVTERLNHALRNLSDAHERDELTDSPPQDEADEDI